MSSNNTIRLIQYAQQLATSRGEPYIVVQVSGGHVIVMRDSELHGAKLLERCWP
ncbi:hypothetical protein SAMN04244579_02421 [Azotobacter beijerinckii]|uniref:Uncharacterized protein n=1 Tax=Azotobacter beijerinckii TaxID=170623 RepID=A0A1H6UTC3_9GAMM|nr:hypothetical protein [Azotobacter beijerinckii]SEI91162.1 hypothetical protein SAMN04244579_02421 [Azotobacter beijerinckii]